MQMFQSTANMHSNEGVTWWAIVQTSVVLRLGKGVLLSKE